MWSNTVAFVTGVFICQQLTVLPHTLWGVASVLALLLSLKYPLIKPPLVLLFGFGWSVLSGQIAVHDNIDKSLVKKEITIQGQIDDLPVYKQNSWRFTFLPGQAIYQGKPVPVPGKIRLSWHTRDVSLLSGQRWQLKVKLSPPGGTLNPGSTDYETWLFQQGIRAKGYVLDRSTNRLLEQSGWVAGFDYLREMLRKSLFQISDSQAIAVLVALSVGDKSAISSSMWDVFRKTGVNHLVAISGLHIGLIAVFFFWLSGLLWRLSYRLCEQVATPQVQAIAAISAAVFYAGLAGFSIPTQRALVMLTTVMLAKMLFRNLQPARQLAFALFSVLLWDPVAVTSAGFWMSFMAVVAIFISSQGFYFVLKRQAIFTMQWSITLVLLPFLIFWFQQISIVSPLVNLFLVPLFSLFFVPAGLLLSFLQLTGWSVVEFFTSCYLYVLSLVLQTLASIAEKDWVTLRIQGDDSIVLLLVSIAIFFWFLPTTRYARLTTVFILVTVLRAAGENKLQDRLQITLLDVGQGLAVVVQYKDRALLYDLGPRYRKVSSATQRIVLPFLEYRQIKHLDQLVISHADSDHAGDIGVILGAISVAEIFTGEPEESQVNMEKCQAGYQWYWYETRFEFLGQRGRNYLGNNASCVLKITHGKSVILLTGDIEKRVERQLVGLYGKTLKSRILVIPHHGSRTSSSRAFVEATRPEVILNSSGYLNHYQFPDSQVKKRWLENGRLFLDTATSGAIKVLLGDNGEMMAISAYREKKQKYWFIQR